jgi:hypothetical protein
MAKLGDYRLGAGARVQDVTVERLTQHTATHACHAAGQVAENGVCFRQGRRRQPDHLPGPR